IFVRSARNLSASGCTPRALSKWIPMGLLLSLTVNGAARRRQGPLLAVCLGMLASASAWAASPVIERSWQDAVEVAARQVLEAKAEQAGWLEPRFEIVVLDGAAGRRAAAPVSCAQVARVKP